MSLRWTVSLLSTMMLMDGLWTLPAPATVTMRSVNMRHTLMWPPLQAPCNTTILYSVQFQGEFELTVLNGRWVDAHECQRIRHARCDLTSDLGSDADYNVHVRAQCGSELSAWTELHSSFNRRDTLLMVPEMTVSAVGDVLHVSFDRLPHTSFINVTMWRRGHELKSAVHMIPAEERTCVFSLQEEGVYCVRAQTVLRPALQSDSTNTQCVSFTAPDVRWKKPTTVTATVLIMAAVLSAVFWSMSHRSPSACRRYFSKEPLPDALKRTDTVIQILTPSPQEEEPCEQIHMMQSVDPELHTPNTEFTSHLGDQRSDLPLTGEFVV